MLFSDTGVAMVDLEGRVAFANSYVCDLLGVEPQDVVGESCFDFVFPEDLEAAKALFEINKLPESKPFRFRLRRKDGSALWVDVQSNAMRTASGDVYGVLATVTLSESRSSDSSASDPRFI